MKPAKKILFIILVTLVFIYILAYISLILQGKTIIVKQLESVTQKKVSLDYLTLSPPLNFNIKNLHIQGLFSVKSAYISPSIIGLLTGRTVFNTIRLREPELTYERIPPATEETAQAGIIAPLISEITGLSIPAPTPAETPKVLAVKPAKPFYLIIKRLKIKDGRIIFLDRTVSKEGIRINVRDLYCNVTNLYLYPQSAITNFELEARIPWQDETGEGKISFEGWLNLFKKDMQATLKIEDIDGVYLYPYYANWVDLEKARIERARLNFKSNIHSLNNDLTAECHLELTDIVRKPRSAEEPQEKAEMIAEAVLDIFRALNQGKIVLDFTIPTKMDRPEFGIGNIKMAFEDKLAQGRKGSGLKVENVLFLPAKLIEGTIKGATDISKAVIGGTVSVGKELKKAVADTFRKEKPQ